jgi:putative oxidoreductase
MTDRVIDAPSITGPEAMSRLADRLATLAPQHAFEGKQQPQEGAPSEGAAPRPRRRSFVGGTINGFNAVCAFLPYALVALALRLVIARVFFLDGQARLDGTPVPLAWHDFSFAVLLPMQLKADAAAVFAQVPYVSATLVTWIVAGAEFALPILLVLGLLTRFSALVLLGVTVVFQLFVTPDALWTTHVYWASILLVLISLGAGSISIDGLVKWIVRR